MEIPLWKSRTEAHQYLFDLDLPVKGDWTVVYAPEWALPMEEQGRSGEAVRLFVETNDEESDRTDTLKLAINDNSELKIVLVQHGTFSDDEMAVRWSMKI